MKIINVHHASEEGLKMHLSREEYTTLASDLAKPLVDTPHLHGAIKPLAARGV